MQDIDRFAWIARNHVRGEVRAIVLRFPGLGANSMRNGLDPMELAWADAGALVVTPYYNPWAWMSPDTRNFVDELVDEIARKYGLNPAGIPITVTGESMGGHGALAYTLFSRHRITACMANCPVCDLLFHYGERPDLPRTLHSAFNNYGDLTETLIANSPLHQADQLPAVPYFIVHGQKDKAVAKAKHSDALVEQMRRRNLSIEYVELPEMEHCGPLTYAAWGAMRDFVIGQIRGV